MKKTDKPIGPTDELAATRRKNAAMAGFIGRLCGKFKVFGMTVEEQMSALEKALLK